MSDRYLVTDWGYQVLDMETGELFANELPRQWVNVPQQGVVAMERINQNANNALVDLGETTLELKQPETITKPGKG